MIPFKEGSNTKSGIIKSEAIFILIIMLASILFTFSRGVHRYGDGSNFYLMAISLAKDGDLMIGDRDIARWSKDKFEDVPAGLYFIVDKNEILRYAKPILYSFIAAPFSLLGPLGFIILNGLLLGGCIVFCYLFLLNYLDCFKAFIISVLFFFCSFIPVYSSWIHQEILLFFLCSFCLWLWICKRNFILSAFIIGVAITTKPIFLFLLLPILADLILLKKNKELIICILACFLGFIIFSFITVLYLKQILPYAGSRGYVMFEKSILNPEDLKKQAMFLNFKETQFYGFKFISPQLFFMNYINFFIGRFTGLLWYLFPGAVCVIIYIILRKNCSKEEKVRSDSILVTALLLITTLIISRPLNYFGGGEFICNRYFFIAPAFLYLAAVKIFKKHFFYILLFIPGFFVAVHLLLGGVNKANTKMHTRFFPLKYAPFEIAQSEAIFGIQHRLSDAVWFYTPLGVNRLENNTYKLDKGQEFIVRVKKDIDFVKIDTDGHSIALKPAIKLKNGLNNEHIAFFYYKARNPVLIRGIAPET